MKRRAPLSVEDLVRQKKEQENVAKRPKFVSMDKRQGVKETEKPEKRFVEKKKLALAIDRDDDEAVPSIEQKLKKRAPPSSSRTFKFEWSNEDDTVNESDYLLNSGAAPVAVAQGGGQEARRLRQLEIERQKQKAGKHEWDDKAWWEKPLDKMTSRDWRILKDDFEIATQGTNIPHPLRSWHESSIPSELIKTIDTLGYKEPSKIQRAAIPLAMSGRDVLGVAETGSGKTAAFVVPMLSYTMNLPPITAGNRDLGPYAVVLAPTRELALQIETETNKFCKPIGFRCVSMVGGHQMETQSHEMSQGAEIVIATPGRLKDNLEKHILVLSQCCYVVMDEADRMISMGFEEQLNAILEFLPVNAAKPRQTMMFTATLPPAIEKLADKYLHNPGTVTIGRANQGAAQVEQRVEFIPRDGDQRVDRLLRLLKSQFKPPIIVFMNRQHLCDEVADKLHANGHKSVVLHGKKSQDRREQALQRLKTGQADILVATDVAGRGIDIPDVSLVVNFQMSKEISAYTHRIGRTGRAGKKGTAITFLGDEDEPVFKDLANLISQSEASKVSDELRRRARTSNKLDHIKD